MFEMADGGTMLLDEIGDMDVRLQAKLLQVLQDHEFHRIGGKETIKVDVRVMAATHRDLEQAIADRTFREDLYYRLNVINLVIPPLRERGEDIVPMAEFLMKKHSSAGVPTPPITLELQARDEGVSLAGQRTRTGELCSEVLRAEGCELPGARIEVQGVEQADDAPRARPGTVCRLLRLPLWNR